MKSKSIIFTQSSLKSRLDIVTAIMVVMVVASLATNPDSLMISAHATPKTTIISPSVEDAVSDTNATNSNVDSAGLATDIFDASTTTPTNVTPEKTVKTLADIQVHSESELSQANQNLLIENAKLQREINDLETQVNVLVAERGGQLFLYGAATALASFIVGGLFSLLLFGRRRESRY